MLELVWMQLHVHSLGPQSLAHCVVLNVIQLIRHISMLPFIKYVTFQGIWRGLTKCRMIFF
jgi:hypothetical protein